MAPASMMKALKATKMSNHADIFCCALEPGPVKILID